MRKDIPQRMLETGLLWVFTRDVLLEKNNRIGDIPYHHPIREDMALHCDEMWELEIAELLIKKRSKEKCIHQLLNSNRMDIFSMIHYLYLWQDQLQFDLQSNPKEFVYKNIMEDFCLFIADPERPVAGYPSRDPVFTCLKLIELYTEITKEGIDDKKVIISLVDGNLIEGQCLIACAYVIGYTKLPYMYEQIPSDNFNYLNHFHKLPREKIRQYINEEYL
jgi:hypothetical protein